jgi:hypothetical protein
MSTMADDDQNDNGQNPIAESANLNINNLTLSQLHEVRNAINIRIDELAHLHLLLWTLRIFYYLVVTITECSCCIDWS